MKSRFAGYRKAVVTVALALGTVFGAVSPAEAQLQLQPVGSSSAVKGDFNGDGYADLAVGVPGENSGAGGVNVIYGSSNGLMAAATTTIPASQFWSQGAGSQDGDGFGSALAAGNFNGDDFSDLAIGVPSEDTNLATDSGRIIVLYGSANGLTATGAQTFDVGSFTSTVFDSREWALGEDSFGAALASGDFDGDLVDDLAVGAPGFEASLGRQRGAVFTLRGEPVSGLSVDEVIDETEFVHVGPNVQLRDWLPLPPARFGATLAAGDFNGDGSTDLAIGAPLNAIQASGGFWREAAGSVIVVFGAGGIGLYPRGLPNINLSSALFFDQCLVGIPSSCAFTVAPDNAQFGAALAVGDFNNDGMDDLAMAAPLQFIAGALQGGVVRVFHGPFDQNNSGRQTWHQSSVFPGRDQFDEVDGDGSPTEPDDRFGTALAAGDFNADGRDDLAVGSPREVLLVIPVGATVPTQIDRAGAVTVIYGSDVGLSIDPRDGGRTPQFWTQQFNVEDEPEAGDNFGLSLTALNFGRNEWRQACNPICRPTYVRTADLAIGVPWEDFGDIRNAGAVNVLYGSFSKNGLTDTTDQLWHQGSHPNLGNREDDDLFGKAKY